MDEDDRRHGERGGAASTARLFGVLPGIAGGAFVGRERELGRLRTAWGRALTGDRYLAFLTGEPGIGKTRIAFEFTREVEEGGAVALYGRCDEDPVFPYEPFVQVLQQLAGGLSSEPEVSESARTMLAELVPMLLRSPTDVSVSSDASTRRLVLFEGVRSVLREMAKHRPLLLVLDDLQWAAADTVRLLRYLARGTWGSPVLLLGAFRDTGPPGAVLPLRAAIADLLSDGLLEQIELDGLDAAHVRALSEEFLRRVVDDEDARRIHEASGGNPFFVHELATLEEAGGGPAPTRALPVAAREVIANRLSRLSPHCRELLTIASVLGGTAELALLQALWDGNELALAAGLSEGVAARLLVEAETHYRFSHALIQQSVYQSLSLPQRQGLHLRAARLISSLPAGQQPMNPAVLASHYRKAGGTRVPQEALPAAMAAAEASLAAFALDEAVDWWEWALDLMGEIGTDSDTRARLMERIARLLETDREVVSATGFLQQALRLHEQVGDSTTVATVQSRLGRAHSTGNHRNTDLTTARAYFESAAGPLAKARDRSRLAILESSWATLGVSSFRIDDLRHVELAIQLAAETGSRAMESANDVSRGALAFHQGHLDLGIRLLGEAWRTTRERGDVIQSGGAALVFAIKAQRLCDPLPAVECLRTELGCWPAPAAAAPWGIASRLASALADAGDLRGMRTLAREHTARDEERIEVMVERCAFAFVDGHWHGPAWDEAEMSAVSAAGRGDRCSYQNLGHWLVRAFRARGEPERAIAFIEEELAAMVAGGSVGQEVVARAELAVLLAEKGEMLEAEAHASRCHDILGANENGRGIEGKVLLAEALITSARGGTDSAADQFEKAIEVFRRYSTVWQETRAFEDWAEVLLRARCRAQAASKRREAASVYRRIGAGEPWFERLAALGRVRELHSQSVELPDGLTQREAEVLSKVTRGATSREIAEELVLSIRTVERHIANIYLKTGTHGRAQATAYALAHGLGGSLS